MQQRVKIELAQLRVQGKRLPADTLATTPHQCTAIDSCWEKVRILQNHSNKSKIAIRIEINKNKM